MVVCSAQRIRAKTCKSSWKKVRVEIFISEMCRCSGLSGQPVAATMPRYIDFSTMILPFQSFSFEWQQTLTNGAGRTPTELGADFRNDASMAAVKMQIKLR